MIIECASCQARFRLDESKIKGKAARVQCRKCGNSIYVEKPEAASAGPDSSLDLRALLSGPAGPGAAAPSPDDAPPAPDAGKPPSVPPAGPNTAAAAASGSSLDLRALLEGSSGSAPFAPGPAPGPSALEASAAPEEPAAPPAVEAPAPPGEPSIERQVEGGTSETTSTAEASADFDAAAVPPIEFAPEDALTFGDVPTETGIGEPPREEPPEFPPPPEPTSIGLDTAPGGPADESIPLSDIADSLRSRPEPPSGADAVRAHFAEAERSHESRVDELQDELRGLAGASASPLPPLPPPSRAAEPLRRPVPPAARPAAGPTGRRGARPLVATLAVLFALLAGGGAFLGFTPGGQQVMRNLVSRLDPLLKGGKPAPAVYEVENPVGFYEVAHDASKMFIVKGQIRNVGRSPRSGVRIHAAILDAASRELAQKSAYAGNIVTADALKQARREKLEAELSNRFGENLVNMDIASGKSIPFMVIFFDAPDGIDAFRVEATDGD